MAKQVMAWSAAVVSVVVVVAIVSVVSHQLGSDSQDESSPAPNSTTASQGPADVGYSDCGVEKPKPEPDTMTMTCADGGYYVNQIDWRSWESTMAIGSGTVTVNDCMPDCATGVNIDYPVTILLDKVVTNGAGTQFTRAVLIYADRTPNVDPDHDVDSFALTPYTTNPH